MHIAELQKKRRRGLPAKAANSFCRKVGVVTNMAPPRFDNDPKLQNATFELLSAALHLVSSRFSCKLLLPKALAASQIHSAQCGFEGSYSGEPLNRTCARVFIPRLHVTALHSGLS